MAKTRALMTRLIFRISAISLLSACLSVIIMASAGSAAEQNEKEVQEKIEVLLRDLRGGDVDARWRAEAALVKLGAPAVKPVMETLRSDDHDLRRMAVSILQGIGAPAVDAAIAGLKDPDSKVRDGAATVLLRIGGVRGAEALIDHLLDDSPGVRDKAVRAMGKIRDRRAVGPLVKLLEDPAAEIRKRAINALLGIRDESAVEDIIRALSDRSADVRKAAADALWEMRGFDGVKSLLGSLSEAAKRYAGLSEFSRTYLSGKSPRGIFAVKREEYGDVEWLVSRMKSFAQAYPLFIRTGDDSAEGILLLIFQRHGNRQMAYDFLNCGNEAFKQAVLKWAGDNSYDIKVEATGSGPKWGRK